MARQRGRKKGSKNKSINKIVVDPQGVLREVDSKKPISCLLDPYDNCHGRCQWLSIDEEEIAKCQTAVIGKVVSPPEPD